MEIHKKYTYQHYLSNFINSSTTYMIYSIYKKLPTQNGKQIHYILHIKSSRINPCYEKYQNNIGVLTCEETRNMIHDYISRTIYLSIYIYIDYLIE